MDYQISLNEIEELQMLHDTDQLSKIFAKAKSTIVQGSDVQIVRHSPTGELLIIESIDSETELMLYQKSVFKYL